MESPDYLRTSLAAAITLGFKNGLFLRDAKLYCVNLLITYKDGCTANCAYCGLSKVRPGEYEKKSFIRVSWSSYKTQDIIERISSNKEIKRVCISMITRRKAVDDTIDIAKNIRRSSDVPISLLISPTVVIEDDFKRFKDAGADKIGIAIDAATPEIFDKYRGKGVNGPHKWDRYWECFREGIKYFGKGNVGSHFIVGLGETEYEMIKAIQDIRDLGGETHLFSFFPEEYSLLENHIRPSIPHYRRIQLGRYLIDNDFTRIEKMKFDEKGRIADFGIKIDEFVYKGEPFMTSGCTGKDGKVACNRPFANEKPSEELRNFPVMPEKEELDKIMEELCNYTM